MQINEYLNNQKQIFWELLAATVLELDQYPDITKGELSFGANETALTFRNCVSIPTSTRRKGCWSIWNGARSGPGRRFCRRRMSRAPCGG